MNSTCGPKWRKIHVPRQRHFQLQAKATSSKKIFGRKAAEAHWERRTRKISSNLDPQKYQIYLSDEDLSEEEDEDDNNGNETHLSYEHVQEFHGDYHHHHLQQPPEKSCGKAIAKSSPEKWPHHLISSVVALATKREERMKLSSKQATSKPKLKKAKGDVVEVHGGRIVRSTGRKDRHSKVCTARGPRDRRVRLSPNTAIQFYDVQDRLGYDRPSKAIDWLMKEAKSAIDALDDSSHAAQLNSTNFMQPGNHLPDNSLHQLQNHYGSSKSLCEVQSQEHMNGIPNSNYSFFSMLNGVSPPPSTDQFNTPSQGNRSQAQGICFSFQDFPFLFGGGQQQSLLPPSATSHAESSNAKGGEGSLNTALPIHFQYQQQQPFQREPLQSSFSPSFQAQLNDQHPNLNFACLRYSNDGLLELSAATRFQGDEEQNQISSKPSSATSLLHFQN